MIETLMWSFIGLFLSYTFMGFLLWVIPYDTGAGYADVGFANYNILFIFFWLFLLFTDKLDVVVSK